MSGKQDCKDNSVDQSDWKKSRKEMIKSALDLRNLKDISIDIHMAMKIAKSSERQREEVAAAAGALCEVLYRQKQDAAVAETKFLSDCLDVLGEEAWKLRRDWKYSRGKLDFHPYRQDVLTEIEKKAYECELLRARLEDSEDMNVLLNNEAERMQGKMNHQAEEMRKKINDGLREQIQAGQLQAEKLELREKEARSNETISQLEKELREAKKQLSAALETHKKGIRDYKKKEKAALRKKEREIADAEKRAREEGVVEHKECKPRLNKVTEDLEKITKISEKYVDDLQQCTANLQRLKQDGRKQLDKLATKLTSARESLESSEQRAKSANDTLEIVRRDLKATNESLKKVEGEHSTCTAEIADLTSKLAAMEALNNASRTSRAIEEDRIMRATQNARQRSTELEEENDQMREEIGWLRAERMKAETYIQDRCREEHRLKEELRIYRRSDEERDREEGLSFRGLFDGEPVPEEQQ